MNTPDNDRTATPSPAPGEGRGEVDMLDTVERLDICLIDPSYGIKETQGIAGVSAAAIRRWLSGYPADIREMKAQWINHNDKSPDPLRVSFLELIEILVAGKFRAATGKSFAAVQKHNAALSSEWEAPFPFAHENLPALAVRGEKLLKPVVHTLKQMDYENGYVSLWYPMGKEQPITVDPRRGSGRPVVKGRRVRVQDIRGRFKSGESVEFIAYDFDLERTDVEAALRYALLVTP